MSDSQKNCNALNCTEKQNSLDADNEFTGLIDGGEFLSDEATKCSENVYEMVNLKIK